MSRPAWIAVICILGIIKLVKCNQYPEFIGEKTLKQFFGIDDFNNHYGSSKNPSYTPHFVELENVESTLDRYPPKKGHPKDEIMNISIIVLKAFLQPARHTDNPVEKDDIPVATPSPSIASLVTYWKNDNNGWQYQQSDIEVPQHSIEAQPFFYYDRPLGSRRAMNGMDDSYADDDPTYAANYNPSFPDARKGGAIPGGGGGRGRGLPSYGEPPPDSEESEQPVLRSGPGGGGPPEGYGGPGGPPGYGRPRSLPEYGGPGGPPGYGRPPGYRGPGGPPGYGGPGGPPGYGYPGGPPGYRGPGGPPGYGGRGGPPGYGRPGVPPGYGVSGVPPGYGGNGGPPGYGGPDGPPGYGGLRGPPGYGGPGGPPGYGAGGQNPALGPRSQAYMGVGAPGGPSAHDLLRSGPEGLQYSINPDFPQMPSKAKAVPTGEQLVGITRHKLQLYSQIDEKNRQGNHSYLYTTKPPLDLRSQLLALPRVDDFGAPIKWVKFNSHETVDGLAKVTDPSNMKNQQHMVQGAIYVPVADHNALRMGPTSEEPTTQQSPVESTPYPNYEIVQTVLRSVDINRTTEMDWLAVEAITLNVKGTSVKGCSGEGCQARCRTMNCDSTCTGDSCGSGCIGVSCNAFCKGPGCVTMCIGEFCTTKCDGENCHARCRRYACQQSINGIYTETVPYWDRVEQAEYDADAAAGPGGPGAPGGPARPGGPYGVRSPGGPRQRAQAYDDYYA